MRLNEVKPRAHAIISSNLLYLVGTLNQETPPLNSPSTSQEKQLFSVRPNLQQQISQLSLYTNFRLPEILKRPSFHKIKENPAGLITKTDHNDTRELQKVPSEQKSLSKVQSEWRILQKVQSEQKFVKPKKEPIPLNLQQDKSPLPPKPPMKPYNSLFANMQQKGLPLKQRLQDVKSIQKLKQFQQISGDSSIDNPPCLIDGDDSKIIIEKSFSQEDSQFYDEKMEFYQQQRDKFKEIIRKQSQEERRQKIKVKEQTTDKVKVKVEGRLKEIDGYQLAEILGKGSYAMVKAGINKITSERVAIKMYDKARLYDPVRQKNVYKEIEILKDCNHPNIIKLKKVVQTQKSVNLIMEIGGPTSLKNYLKNQIDRKINEQDVQKIFYQLIQAVDYLHQKGVVHRDIKLDNILIDEQKNIHLIDFGFATRMPTQPSLLHQSCGTPPYMAPEILPPLPKYNETTDIWSCGVVLHLMLTGKFPFSCKNEKDLFTKIKNGKYPRLGNGEVWEVIELCLEKDFEQRVTAQELIQQIWVQGYS